MITTNVLSIKVDIGILRWQILKIRVALGEYDCLESRSLHIRDKLLTVAKYLEYAHSKDIHQPNNRLTF